MTTKRPRAFGKEWISRTEAGLVPKGTPTRVELMKLYDLVRSYCKRERADVDVGSEEMVADWHRICRAVKVRVNPR